MSSVARVLIVSTAKVLVVKARQNCSPPNWNRFICSTYDLQEEILIKELSEIFNDDGKGVQVGYNEILSGRKVGEKSSGQIYPLRHPEYAPYVLSR